MLTVGVEDFTLPALMATLVADEGVPFSIRAEYDAFMLAAERRRDEESLRSFIAVLRDFAYRLILPLDKESFDREGRCASIWRDVPDRLPAIFA